MNSMNLGTYYACHSTHIINSCHYIVFADHFTYSLKCKRRCPDKLNSLNGEKHEDLLPSHYHFLQYAYYKGRILATLNNVKLAYVLAKFI
jgi:hypothetical protein